MCNKLWTRDTEQGHVFFTGLGAVTPNSELITLNSVANALSGPRSSKVELLICNQRVGGSNPSVGSRRKKRATSSRGALF
jgi:hypothetical protein